MLLQTVAFQIDLAAYKADAVAWHANMHGFHTIESKYATNSADIDCVCED